MHSRSSDQFTKMRVCVDLDSRPWVGETIDHSIVRWLSFVYTHVCVWNGNQKECVCVCVNNYIMAGCLFTHCAANDELINKDFNYSPKQGALSHTHWNTTVADRRWHPVAPWFSAGTEMFIVPTIFCLNVSNHCKQTQHTLCMHTSHTTKCTCSHAPKSNRTQLANPLV